MRRACYLAEATAAQFNRAQSTTAVWHTGCVYTPVTAKANPALDPPGRPSRSRTRSVPGGSRGVFAPTEKPKPQPGRRTSATGPAWENLRPERARMTFQSNLKAVPARPSPSQQKIKDRARHPPEPTPRPFPVRRTAHGSCPSTPPEYSAMLCQITPSTALKTNRPSAPGTVSPGSSPVRLSPVQPRGLALAPGPPNHPPIRNSHHSNFFNGPLWGALSFAHLARRHAAHSFLPRP